MGSHRRTRGIAATLALILGGILALHSSEARASEVSQSKKFGIGIILGQPTGVSMKYFFNPKHALTFGLGLGWWGGYNFHIHADYGYHFALKRTPDFDFRLYVGGGVKFFVYYYGYYHPVWDHDWRDHEYGRVGLGLRVPIGIAFHLNKVPLDVFLEVAPGVAFLPWIDGIIDGGFGVRYFF